jgi:hypothetical protein
MLLFCRVVFVFVCLFVCLCFQIRKNLDDLSKIIQKCQQSRQLHNNNNENIVILITIDNNNKKDVSNSAIERLRGDD